MSTFTIARHINGCYELLSWSEMDWKLHWTWCHHIKNKEVLSFQSIFDPQKNGILAEKWLEQDFDFIAKQDPNYDIKQVITSHNGQFKVYNGTKVWNNVYSKIGNGWACAGNYLEGHNYDKYFSNTLLELSTKEIIELVTEIPERLDRRTVDFMNKGNLFEYTLFQIDTNKILKREVSYNKELEL